MQVSIVSKGQRPDHMHSHNQNYWDFVQKLSHILIFKKKKTLYRLKKIFKSSAHDQVRKNIDYVRLRSKILQKIHFSCS